MNRALIAEFDDAVRFAEAVRTLERGGAKPLDALTPFPMPEVASAIIGDGPSPIRAIMALAGFGAAIFAYLLQWYSAVFAYPIDSGGRPFNSWPIFVLVPFEVGIFAAAVAGFVVFLVGAGLPRLNHPLFEYPGLGRASQDRFLVLFARAPSEGANEDMRHALLRAGAISVGECEL
jgi:hypothetical protein